MFINHIKIALRNLFRNRVSSVINILGLSLGLTAFILIAEYVGFEKSVNQFHSNLKNIDRVLYEVSYGGNTYTWESIPPAIAPMAKDQYPEVTDYCRVMNGNGIVSWVDPAAASEQHTFREENVVYTDGSFFNLFSFPLESGSAAVLAQSNMVFISQATSIKYFGKRDAVGKVLTMNNQFGTVAFTIGGVYADFPENSDLKYDIILSLQTLANPENLNGNDWANLETYNTQFIETYLLTHDNTDLRILETNLNKSLRAKKTDAQETIRLQPMANMHLPASLSDHYTTNGTLKFLYILEGIALLIVVIAWFNYVNLSTAGALKRAKEVGVRKVIGASRIQLVRQFLSESLIVNLCSLLIALALVNILQPVYNLLIGKNLSLYIFGQGWIGFALLLLVISGAIASGSYAAFSLSSFKPVETLRGSFARSGKGIWVRQTLVVFQFSISIILIGSTVILLRQMEFMKNEKLGVTLNQRIILSEPEVGADSTRHLRNQTFVNMLSQQSFVLDYSMSGSVPGNGYNYNSAGVTRLNPEPGDDKINYSFTFIDDRFLNVYGISLAAGKNFTTELLSRKRADRHDIMINEQASGLLGFENPQAAVGQKIIVETNEYEITGVVSDYHHRSLKETISPVIYYPAYNSHYFTVAMAVNQPANLKKLETLYASAFPGNPFEYFYAADNYNQQYHTESQYSIIFTIASALAIFIACLGLLGLATFTVEQRMKEIVIRKVLGATLSQITRLLSKDFVRLIIISLVIAAPISWWAMIQWLERFPYRTEINIWIYVGTGVLSVFIALATVAIQAVRAATGNPVEALKAD